MNKACFSCFLSVRSVCGLSLDRHHYWEVKLTGRVYGTAVMVGVATERFLDSLEEEGSTMSRRGFSAVLGSDGESWGLCHDGKAWHGGAVRGHLRRWGQGSILGVHLDTWRGTVEFFLNRESMGVAFRGEKSGGKPPVVFK